MSAGISTSRAGELVQDLYEEIVQGQRFVLLEFAVIHRCNRLRQCLDSLVHDTPVLYRAAQEGDILIEQLVVVAKPFVCCKECRLYTLAMSTVSMRTHQIVNLPCDFPRLAWVCPY